MAEPSAVEKTPAPSETRAVVSSGASWAPPHPPSRLVRASTLDIISNSLVDVDPSRSRQPASPKTFVKSKPPRVKPRMKAGPTDPNVLFDAADFELQSGEEDDSDADSDDFGDFETGDSLKSQSREPPRQKTSGNPPPSLDLLSLEEDLESPQPASTYKPPPQPSQVPSTTRSFGATKPKQNQTLNSSSSTAPRRTNPKPAPASSAVPDDNEEWAAWDDFKPQDQGDPKPQEPTMQADSWDWGAVDTKPTTNTTSKASSIDDPPPVNVPPPSVLLSAFPALIHSGADFFKPISGPNASLRQRVLSDPKAIDFLRGYILLATTAAHVMAGRKHRWHRDKILAKSMSLSAAGSKGMKLAGVDKTQTAREDREAADVAAAWRDNVGRLRSAVAAANSAGQAPLKVPELGETMALQTAKSAPTAPKPCVICGLKREERVVKVDHDVEDSFGEWWIDHWGHRACRNFWIEHERTLRQR